MTTLADLHSMPEIPAIAHFCSLFKSTFKLDMDFEIDDLEAALLQQNSEDMFSCTLVERLAVALLQGCLPTFASRIHQGNFSSYLVRLLATRREEAEEEGGMQFNDPFESREVEDWAELEPTDQVRVLHLLTEFRLAADDVAEKVKDLEPEGLRVEPLGEDSNSVIYWYFFGTRLYKEVKPRRKKPKKKGGEGAEEVVGEEEEEPAEPPGWHLSCSSLSQWSDLVLKYKKSKKKKDKELYDTLNENFLPEITKMFEEKEKAERLKLMMASKRSSSRLDRKREMQEQEFMKKIDREKQKELEKEEEEARKKQKENENKQKSREMRAKNRELNQVISHRLEILDNDHDYLKTKRGRMTGRGRAREENSEAGGELRLRRCNPALKEFRRLERLGSEDSSEESAAGRKLRM